jgi:Co/Zn/Cd efflux system component
MGTGHSHSAPPDRFTAGADTRRRLAITLGLVSAYMVAEVVGGLMATSLALLAWSEWMARHARVGQSRRSWRCAASRPFIRLTIG